MIDSKFHVEINGKKYTLAEDAEGTHYQRKREPLRAPTNGFVLGDTNKFSLRPDLLEWNMTDWSGGEGVLVHSTEDSNRYSVGYNIDPLKEYGTLRLSGLATEILPQGAEAALEQGELTLGLDAVYFLDGVRTTNTVTPRIYDEINGTWDIADSEVEVGTPKAQGALGTSTYIYFQSGNAETLRWDGSSIVTYNNIPAVTDWLFGSLNGLLYVGLNDSTGVLVFELDMQGTPTVTGTEIGVIQDLGNVATSHAARWSFAAGTNRAYIVVNTGLEETTVYTIEPTTAAGAGFISEAFRVKGFQARFSMVVLGILFIVGLEMGVPTTLYYDPIAETFGAFYRNIERVVEHANAPDELINEFAGDMDGVQFSKGHYVMAGGPNFTNGREWQHMIIDAATAATVGGTVIDSGTTFTSTDVLGRSTAVVFKGALFVAITSPYEGGVGLNTSRTWRIAPDAWTANTGILESAINDFGLVDEKVLQSFSILTDPLPSDCTVVVKYQLDQDGTWLTAGTMSTNDATEETFVVSTDSTTRQFRNLQVRIELSNGGTTTQTPVLRSCRARATVIQGVRTWQLILNASDELGAMQNRAWDGATLIDNITSAADNDQVVSFKDGYNSRKSGEHTEYDVVIDEYTVVNDRAGEGIVHISLREVG